MNIVKEDPEVRAILDDAGKAIEVDVVADIKAILTHTYKPHYVGDVISSQLDVDRFDYLLRDSAMTGARYGSFDLAWFLRTLEIAKIEKPPETIQTLAVQGRRGLSALEGYLLGRHYMFKHVYFHKTIRAAEAMLRAILKRVVLLVREGKMDSPHSVISALALKQLPSLRDYLALNDFQVLSWIQDWSVTSADEILKDLSRRFQSRHIFGTVVAPRDRVEFRDKFDTLRALIGAEKLDEAYYLLEDKAEDVAYKDYFYDVNRGKESEHQEIYCTDGSGRPQPLSGHDTSVIMAAKSVLKFDEIRWYIPKEVLEKAKTSLRSYL
jgi:hypothetical protein